MSDSNDHFKLDEQGIPVLNEIIKDHNSPLVETMHIEMAQIRKEMILELYTELDSFSKAIAQAAAIQITTDLESQIQHHLKTIIDAKLADLVEGVLKRPTY